MARNLPYPRLRSLGLMFTLAVATLVGTGLLAQTGGPNIQVTVGSTTVAYNSTLDWGEARVGVAVSKTFTVTNTGSANLVVSEAITVPQGFTLMASFPGVPDVPDTNNNGGAAFTIAPNASATFVVALNSATAGRFTGNVSLATNVTGQNPFQFTVTGLVVPPLAVSYIDDRDASFSATSGWTTGQSDPNAFQKTVASAPGAGQGETGTYTWHGLQPGTYRVSATWAGYANAATDTPFTLYDGSTPVQTVRVDQTQPSSGFTDGASVWQDLGTITISDTTLVVTITDNVSDPTTFVYADGVRVNRVGYSAQIIDDSSSAGFSTTGTWTADTSDPLAYQAERLNANGTTGAATATALWTFTVTPNVPYRVLAGYTGDATASQSASYSVLDNTTTLATVTVNQQVTPTDARGLRIGWKDLGIYTSTSGTLCVQLTNSTADGLHVNADAAGAGSVNPTSPSMADTVRFLEQATWGPTPALITSVQSQGFNAFLSDPNSGQFFVAPTSYPTLPLYNTNNNLSGNSLSCASDGTTNGNSFRTACLRDHYSMYPLQNQFFTNALYGQDQLRQRVAWELHKIWVISGVDITQSAWVAPYLQILSGGEDGNGAGTFGNYRTLMYNVTLNAGMGAYLNMAGSRKAAGTTQPNENYPREIMQLFTIGLFELNPDGSQKLDSTGQPIPTYDQNLVDEMSRVFTGWNYAPAVSSGVPDYISPMRLNGTATENAQYHDFGSKNLLRGYVQPAITGTGTTGTAGVTNAYLQLNRGLDNIYNHPSLPPFICKQLIQSLVTSNPSPAYVARVVDTFNRNRTSPYQMRAVVQAILLDPEARGDRKNANNYGKLREPVLYVNNLMRMYGALSDNLSQNSDGYLSPYTANFSQDVFRPPSVFSYYSPGKVAVGGNPPVLGPEFQVQNTSTALARVNFVNQCFTPNSSRTIDVVRAHGTTPSGTDLFTGQPLVPTGPNGTAVDVTFLVNATGGDPNQLADQLNALMLHGTMTPEMRNEIVTAVSAVASTNVRKRVHTAIYLVASSSQYQVQQ